MLDSEKHNINITSDVPYQVVGFEESVKTGTSAVWFLKSCAKQKKNVLVDVLLTVLPFVDIGHYPFIFLDYKGP